MMAGHVRTADLHGLLDFADAESAESAYSAVISGSGSGLICGRGSDNGEL
jgi:homoserine kinase